MLCGAGNRRCFEGKGRGDLYKAIIVEDEMFVRMGIRMSVEWEKLGVEIAGDAENGQAAWELYEKEHPDIVLTDIKMPVMTGIELIAKIRERDKRTRIVILSCLEEFSMIKEAMSLGVTDYILKLTMTQEDMVAVMDKVIGELKIYDASVSAGEYSESTTEKRLIEITHYNKTQTLQELSQTALPFDRKNMLLAVLEINHMDRLQEQFHDKYGDIVQYSLLNIFNELLEQYMKKGVVLSENERTYLILAGNAAKPVSMAEFSLDELLRAIIRTLDKYFHIRPTVAVSQMCDGLEHLHAMRLQCNEVLEYRYLYPSGSILKYTAVMQQDFGQGIREILSEIQKHSVALSRSTDFLRGLEEEILRRPTSQTCVRLFGQMAELEMKETFMSDQQRLQVMRNLQESLERSENLPDLARNYLRYVQSLSDLSVDSVVYLSKPVSMAVEFIKRNYRQEIQLSDLSDYAQVSPNYICSLFKKEVGMNISKYVMEYRIKKAKVLLLTTNMKSYEIAVETGFANESYFSRSFKKMTGVSPSEFRRQEYEGSI